MKMDDSFEELRMTVVSEVASPNPWEVRCNELREESVVMKKQCLKLEIENQKLTQTVESLKESLDQNKEELKDKVLDL